MSILLEEALKLPVPERIRLADKLYESVAGGPGNSFPLTDEQLAELERRMEEHRRDPGSAVPWEVVRERLFNRS